MIRDPNDGEQRPGPAELGDMQAVFDASWLRLQDLGFVEANRVEQQRARLAGIIIRMMQDGQNVDADIVETATTEFVRNSNKSIGKPRSEF